MSKKSGETTTYSVVYPFFFNLNKIQVVLCGYWNYGTFMENLTFFKNHFEGLRKHKTVVFLKENHLRLATCVWVNWIKVICDK